MQWWDVDSCEVWALARVRPDGSNRSVIDWDDTRDDTSMGINPALGIGIGVAAAGALGFGVYEIVKHVRNHEESEDGLTNRLIQPFDSRGNNDGKLNIEFETKYQEEVHDRTWISTDNNGGGYYSYDDYTLYHSIASLAQRADQLGNKDGTADHDEIVNVMKGYDKGDGDKHPANDGRLGGAEYRNFMKDFGPTESRSGYGGGYYA